MMPSSNKGGLIAIIVLAIAIAVLGYLYFRANASGHSGSQSGLPATIHAVFTCDTQATITADFTKDSVYLELSDGRSLSLPEAISASGARYANSDESFVFWNKGKAAFIEEGGTTTYANCST